MSKDIETSSEFSSQRTIGTIYIAIEIYDIVSILIVGGGLKQPSGTANDS